MRTVVVTAALILAAYCLIAAATALAQPAVGQPNPEELAARERYRWPGLIPVVFLALVALYAIGVAARRRGRGRNRRGPPSTQDPPPIRSSDRDRRRDTASR